MAEVAGVITGASEGHEALVNAQPARKHKVGILVAAEASTGGGGEGREGVTWGGAGWPVIRQSAI